MWEMLTEPTLVESRRYFVGGLRDGKIGSWNHSNPLTDSFREDPVTDSSAVVVIFQISLGSEVKLCQISVLY